MGIYSTAGSDSLGVFLTSFFPAATRVEIAQSGDQIEVVWYRFGDPASHIALRLTGENLTVFDGALIAGTISAIEFLLVDQTYLAAELTGLGITATRMQNAIDAYISGTAPEIFETLLMTNVTTVRTSAGADEYAHYFPHNTMDIQLLGGDDTYQHVIIAGQSTQSLVLHGGTGFDTLVTVGQGRSTVDFERNLFIDADGTSHTIHGFEEVVGQDGGDVLIGALAKANRFDGGLGADYLQGGDRADWLRGGDGKDTIRALGGDDLIFGDADNDDLDGGDGIDTVSFAQERVKRAVTVDLERGTSTGFDTGIDKLNNIENIVGSGGDDILRGDGRANVLDGRRGDDLLDGGAGSDTASYSQANSGVAVYLEFSGKNVGGDMGRDQFVSIENLRGSAFDDRLVGDRSANKLTGDAGDDLLKGKGGADRFDGGAGADRLIGADVRDVMFGGDDGDVLVGLAGADVLDGGAGDDLIYGGRENDVMTGGRGADRLRGNLGNDEMSGGNDSDDLRGGGGHDTLSGGAGHDVLIGGGGQDILIGGAGDDVLTGGLGAGILDGVRDTFVFDGNGFDRVKDFEAGIDVIDLSALELSDLEGIVAETSAGLRLDFGDGAVLFLEDVSLAEFDVGDVALV